MLIKYGLKSLSFLFALWTQGMDAGYNLRLHAWAGPNLAALRSHPDLCDAYQASFTYPTPMSVPKSAPFTYLTPMLAPKSASFTQPTRLQAPKRAVCVNLPTEADCLYIVHVNHFIESPQNKLRVFLSHHLVESNKRSVFNSTHRSGSNIHCEYKPLYISDRLIQRIFEPIHSLDCDIRWIWDPIYTVDESIRRIFSPIR